MNRCPNAGFAGRVGQTIRERAELTLRGMGGSNSPFELNMREATGQLASYAETRAQEDPTLTALWILSGHRGDSDDFNPGPAQTSFLANLGYGSEAAPKPQDALVSLVRAGIEDLADEQAEQQRRGNQAIQQAVSEARAEVESEKAQLKAELEDAKAALSDAAAVNADLQQQLEALQEVHAPAKKRAKAAA